MVGFFHFLFLVLTSTKTRTCQRRIYANALSSLLSAHLSRRGYCVRNDQKDKSFFPISLLLLLLHRPLPERGTYSRGHRKKAVRAPSVIRKVRDCTVTLITATPGNSDGTQYDNRIWSVFENSRPALYDYYLNRRAGGGVRYSRTKSQNVDESARINRLVVAFCKTTNELSDRYLSSEITWNFDFSELQSKSCSIFFFFFENIHVQISAVSKYN